jgi:hypothetical protein
MKTLLTSIQAHLIAELTYLQGVFIVPDFFIYPQGAGFPMVALLDGGDSNSDKEKGARLELLRVSIGIYQAVASGDDASVVGDGTDKGVLEIKDDIMGELRDKVFTGYQAPFYIRASKTQALESRDFEGFVAFKSIDLDYLHEVVEAT